jgi:hypothetical protein
MSSAALVQPALRVWGPAVRLRHVWILLTLVGTFLGPATSPLPMLDLGSTLRSGAWMVEHGQLLVTDPFTSAPAVAHQVNAQWIAQLIYYSLYRLGDLQLVIAGNAAAATLAYGLLLATCVATTRRVRLSCAAVGGAYLLGFTNLAPRPQTLAYPLFGLFLLVLARAQRPRGRRWLGLLVPATTIWANLHGSFVLGLVLLGCAAAGAAWETRSARAVMPFALALLGCLVAACVTPYGAGSVAYVTSIGTHPIIRDMVTEWAPTSIASTEGVLFFGSVLGLIVLLLRSPRRLRPTEVLVLMAFGGLGLAAVRSVVWWGMASAPILANLLAGLIPPRRTAQPERPALNLLLVLLLCSLVVIATPWVKASNPLLPNDQRGLIEQEVPDDLLAYLRVHTYAGRMLTHQGWGGYFDWTLWPTHQPFVDGRIELHEPKVWLDYLAMTTPRADWQALTDQYGIGYMVLWKRAEGGLIEVARASDAWRIDYEDDQAVVFVRL